MEKLPILRAWGLYPVDAFAVTIPRAAVLLVTLVRGAMTNVDLEAVVKAEYNDAERAMLHVIGPSARMLFAELAGAFGRQEASVRVYTLTLVIEALRRSTEMKI